MVFTAERRRNEALPTLFLFSSCSSRFLSPSRWALAPRGAAVSTCSLSLWLSSLLQPSSPSYFPLPTHVPFLLCFVLEGTSQNGLILCQSFPWSLPLPLPVTQIQWHPLTRSLQIWNLSLDLSFGTGVDWGPIWAFFFWLSAPSGTTLATPVLIGFTPACWFRPSLVWVLHTHCIAGGSLCWS